MHEYTLLQTIRKKIIFEPNNLSIALKKSVHQLTNYFLKSSCLLLFILLACFAQAQSNTVVNKGTCITGNCVDGYGVMTFENGDKYSGTFLEGKFNGSGAYNYKDGSRYEGSFFNNSKNGKGRFYYPSGNRYDGEYVSNEKEGYGIFYYSNGDKYEGAFIKNNKEGKGIFYYASGNKYEGDFKNDKMEGNGILTLTYGNRYVGIFSNNMIHGYGVYFFNDGSRYEGNFVNGKKQGKGFFYFKDGGRFEGDFLNDAMDGHGYCYYDNKDKYEGGFRNGLANGYGVYYYSNGDKLKGKFQNNNIEGVGLFKTADGIINKVKYKNGLIILPDSTADSTLLAIIDTALMMDTASVSVSEFDSTIINEIALFNANPKTIAADTAKMILTVAKNNLKADTIAVAKVVLPACKVCKGTGKIWTEELKHERIVTKDISNGQGPRNFVTYTVNETVRPKGFIQCSNCHGAGRK